MNHIQAISTRCGKCEGCAVSHRAVCRGAGPEARADLDRITHLRTYERGQIILGQGEDTAIVGHIVEGVVKILNSSMEGHQHVVGLMFSSDFVGRVYADTSRFSYEAATDVTLCCMGRTAFERFLSDYPDVEHELLLSKLEELDIVREWISIVSGHTTMQRLAMFLYVLAKRAKNRGCDQHAPERPIIEVPISRRDLAAYLGTTPETLSRNIQALSRRKVLRIIDAKHLELLDEPQLVLHAGEAEEDLEGMAALRD